MIARNGPSPSSRTPFTAPSRKRFGTARLLRYYDNTSQPARLNALASTRVVIGCSPGRTVIESSNVDRAFRFDHPPAPSARQCNAARCPRQPRGRDAVRGRIKNAPAGRILLLAIRDRADTARTLLTSFVRPTIRPAGGPNDEPSRFRHWPGSLARRAARGEGAAEGRLR